ncbi:hypothetical protein [Streptomyces varsoviensis]|uniref:hypothetical protein n=1 Tax=Streptomyces varsoviensis TaxID=67373 RepID=UPI0005671016|nr:hypothetical protein [Streptomyces varsoviensis]
MDGPRDERRDERRNTRMDGRRDAYVEEGRGGHTPPHPHMEEHEDDALHAAFRDVLGARPEPPLPSVTDAAVAGGRRIRRRRAALSVAGALAVVAVTVTVAVGVVRPSNSDRVPAPIAPAGTTGPTVPVPPPVPPSYDPAVPDPERSKDAADHRGGADGPATRFPASGESGESGESGAKGATSPPALGTPANRSQAQSQDHAGAGSGAQSGAARSGAHSGAADPAAR